MSKSCGKCGKSFTVSKKYKPQKGQWPTWEMKEYILKWGEICQDCMDKAFPPKESTNEE